MYFHVLSPASLWSCRENRLFPPASWAPPLIGWLHFQWPLTRPITSLILEDLMISGCKHIWKSRCSVCSYRRPAIYLQSVTTGCFWTLSYTVLMFDQVLAGQSANVGISPESQYGVSQRRFNTELRLRTVTFLGGMCTGTSSFLHLSTLQCFFSVVCCG